MPEGPDLHAFILVSHSDIINHMYGLRSWYGNKVLLELVKTLTKGKSHSLQWEPTNVPIRNYKGRDGSDFCSSKKLRHFYIFEQEHSKFLAVSWGQKGDWTQISSVFCKSTNQQTAMQNWGHKNVLAVFSNISLYFVLKLVHLMCVRFS